MNKTNIKFKRGFTLVEILVVVAIIGLLSVLLFPVFSRVREQTRRATCLSNLKQIGMGTMQYTQDAAGRFPMGNAFWDRNLPDRYLANVMKPYVSLDTWDCPSWQARYDSEDLNSPGNYSFITATNGVIGFPRILGDTKRSAVLLRVRQPAHYPLFFCGSAPSQVVRTMNQLNAHSGVADDVWKNATTGVVGGTSILYGDLHAKYVMVDRSQWDKIYSTLP